MMISFAGWSKPQAREQCQRRSPLSPRPLCREEHRRAGNWKMVLRVSAPARCKLRALGNTRRGEQSNRVATASCPVHPGLAPGSVTQGQKAPDPSTSPPNFSGPAKDTASVQAYTSSAQERAGTFSCRAVSANRNHPGSIVLSKPFHSRKAS